MIDLFKKSKITINGTEYNGNNIITANGSVLVDNKRVKTDSKVIKIEIHGDCKRVDITSGDIHCGDISGNIDTVSGNINAEIVNGNIDTVSGNVTSSKNIVYKEKIVEVPIETKTKIEL